MSAIEVLKASAPVMPVIEIPSLDAALPLAEALASGGIKTLEITLRTDCALAAIELLAERMPELCIGAGTVKSVSQYQQAVKAGAQFVISPGLSDSMRVLADGLVPLIPGVMSASEVMNALEAGFLAMKLFPAAAVGPQMLKGLSGPFPEAVFCPTGGISPENMQDYLQLPNVVCVGGSWLAPKQLVQQKRWSAIKDIAAALPSSTTHNLL